MTQKFKVGDLVYCRYYKKKGIVSYVRDSLNFVRVKFAEMHAEVSYQSDGTLFPGEGIYLRKVKTFTLQDMLYFANYCIGEGFTSNASKRDLVTFLNSRK